MSDLVPTAAPMAVGDSGTADGREFVVGGRLQLDHGRGPWDEWYVELERGRWGWLARAQGHWYLTFPIEASGLPSYEQMVPGNQGKLPGSDVQWTASERGQSKLVSAEGELPMPARPGSTGTYVDLEGPDGEFATIDYGDGNEPPVFYVGRKLSPSAMTLRQTGVGPRPEERVDVSRLRCPTCGSPVPIRVPEATERAACAHCNTLLNFERGELSVLSKLNQETIEPRIPLGQEGTIDGVPHLCIGFMEREVYFDGERFAWQEYLLHTPNGYRWLLLDSEHFTYLKPISAGQVNATGSTPMFQGQTYKPFSDIQARVSYVAGEFYWRVTANEATRAQDFIAPPYLLSCERSAGQGAGSTDEINWSHGRYMPAQQVYAAFDLPGRPRTPADVAPAQPNPVNVRVAVAFSAVFLMLLFLLTGYLESRRPAVVGYYDGPVPMSAIPDAKAAVQGASTIEPSTPLILTPGDASEHVSHTPPIVVPEGEPFMTFGLDSSVKKGWVGLGVALINEATGEVREFPLEIDAFHTEGAESPFSSKVAKVQLDGVAPGAYQVRLQSRWARNGAANATPPVATLTITNERPAPSSFGCCCFSGFLLLMPAFFAFVRKRWFESRRWRNSNL